MADRSTPRPWHTYVGGNFVKIACEGYDEYVERENYLAGPHCVASIQTNATTDHSYDMLKAIANAEIIQIAVNSYPVMDEALSKIAAAGDPLASKIARSAQEVIASQIARLRMDLDAERERIKRETPRMAGQAACCHLVQASLRQPPQEDC